MKKDKKNKTSNFDLTWFKKKNMDLVDDTMEVHISNLLDLEEYIEINRKFQKLSLDLISALSPEQRKLLMEYQNVELQITSYQNCLAYYLGLKENSNTKIK